MLIHTKHKIFGDVTQLGKCTSDVADIYRIMCKDVYNLKRGAVKRIPKQVADLVAPIQLPSPAGSAASASATPAALADSEQAAPQTSHQPDCLDFPDFDDIPESTEDNSDDPEITSLTCNCPTCQAKKNGENKLESVSKQLEIPSAARGGQRAQTPGSPKPKMTGGMRRPAAAPRLKLGMKRPAAAVGDAIEMPVTVVKRRGNAKKVNEAYILSGANKRYLISLSAKVSTDCHEIMDELAQKIRAGEISTSASAAEWISKVHP